MLTPPNCSNSVALSLKTVSCCFDGHRADSAPQSRGSFVYLRREARTNGACTQPVTLPVKNAIKTVFMLPLPLPCRWRQLFFSGPRLLLAFDEF
jgi:hypothetical protein